MTNNDKLRSLRYALDLDDPTMLELFASAVTRSQLAAFFKREEDPGYDELSDELFAGFLDSFVARRRGPHRGPAGSPPRQPPALTNNRILRSLRIALELKDQDMIAIMALAGVRISKGEVSALFRRAEHRNYRECGDQFLRNFFRGLALYLRR